MNKQLPYSSDELTRPGHARRYTGRQLDQIAFPLGGIGTGSISLGGWGQLRDFEIFNRPNKGLQFQMTFFTLFAQPEGGEAVTRVLQGPVGGDNFTHGGVGVDRATGAGLPHFKNASFEGSFPLARLELDDPKMPLQVALEAFNPFIPLNDRDSSLPVAVFLIHLHNPTSKRVKATLFANLENRIGHPEVGEGEIAPHEEEGLGGLVMRTRKHDPSSPRYGTLALMTPHQDLNVATHWFRGGWFDSLHYFWDHASESGELPENRETAQAGPNATDIGSIGLRTSLGPGESVTLPVVIAWHIPNFEKYWGGGDPKPTWKNWYATQWEDALDVARYTVANLPRLEEETRRFKDALFESTLPEAVLDAVSSQISILKTTTCLRLTDGTFYGWEGCHPNAGCCEGTCTHVWNYAQALPFLFPTLERSIREADYRFDLTPPGHMTFRMPLPLGTQAEPKFHPAADGQMGGILKLYREWLLSGDDEWLKTWWPAARQALEYAWQYWDADRDGVMEGIQHNTYDIEFYGPNTMMGSFYLAALRAGEEISRHLGDTEKAEEYRRLFESGRRWMDAHLFNGEFYYHEVDKDAKGSHGSGISLGGQDLDPKTGGPKYQYGTGCLSDQLIGQWIARIVGLGDLFDPEKVNAALGAIFRYNWKPDLSEHVNPQRIYALNDEAGLILCSWPKGGRQQFPFPYSDEVWPGIEYQVASHLIYEGRVEEGLAIVKGVRDRHDGTRRNPWNEFECGNHYARSMASYSVLTALAGFSFDASEKRLGFAPRLTGDTFSCFFSNGTGWGLYRQERDSASLEVRYGTVELAELAVPLSGNVRAELNGSLLEATAESGVVRFGKAVRVDEGGILAMRFE
ncbi:MAG: hypothetical protein KY468_05455 [Armatimonadetes bacterium]|nr:hypothetical protein [Armatimonadota bacterium]